MKNINTLKIKRFYYHLTHDFLTMNNAVVIVGALIAISWAWGSIGVMERNYKLQKQVDDKARLERLTELQVKNLAFQQQYYQTDEYKELSIREHLALGRPGEKMLVLPPNSKAVLDAENTDADAAPQAPTPSNFEQWMNFLFGRAQANLKK